jgi:hypothetical protein
MSAAAVAEVSPKRVTRGHRPRRFSVEQVAKALRAANGVMRQAARRLGCHRDTVENYVARHESLRKLRRELIEENTDTAENGLLRAVKREEPWAIRFWLVTQGRARGYARDVNINTLVQVNAPDMAPMSDPQRLADVVQILAESGVGALGAGSSGDDEQLEDGGDLG